MQNPVDTVPVMISDSHVCPRYHQKPASNLPKLVATHTWDKAANMQGEKFQAGALVYC